MAEKEQQPEVVKPQGEELPSVNPSASQTLPTPTNSAKAASDMDETPKEADASQNTQHLTQIFGTFSKGLLVLKDTFFDELPSPLQERFSRLAKNFRKTGHQFFMMSIVRSYIRGMEDFVDASGSIIRRLQRVVETENDCLPSCPYLQHYVTCPRSENLPCSPISESDEPAEDEDSTEKPSSEIPVKEEPKCESSEEKGTTEVPESSSAELEEDQEPSVPETQLPSKTYAQESSLEKLFSLIFTWLVLYPVNALVALLNFQRSLTHDLDDYFQIQTGYVTTVGRRILSPRRVIRSRLLTRTKTLFNEVIQLSAGDRMMPFKLALDPNLFTLRAQPVHEDRKASLKRKISLNDLADSLMSDDDFPDDDYEPSKSSQSSASDSNEDSITVSENDLSVHEEGGFLALKEKPSMEEKPDFFTDKNTPSCKTESLEAESQC